MESSAEFYYEKLKGSISPGTVLASMYCVLYDTDVTRSEIIMFNKLLKIFGRFIIFFSIIDMVGSYPEKIETPYPLLYTICKKRFESAHSESFTQSREPLDRFLNNLEKEIDSLKSSRKSKIPSPKGLEPDGGE